MGLFFKSPTEKIETLELEIAQLEAKKEQLEIEFKNFLEADVKQLEAEFLPLRKELADLRKNTMTGDNKKILRIRDIEAYIRDNSIVVNSRREALEKQLEAVEKQISNDLNKLQGLTSKIAVQS